METDYTLAIIAIVLSLIALIGIGYVYVEYEPDTTDLSGVESQINTLYNKITILERNIGNIDTDCECDVDKYDIEDIEDDIDNIKDDINDLEDDVEDIDLIPGPQGIQGIQGIEGPINEDVLECLLVYASELEEDENATTRLPDLLVCLNDIEY